MRRVTVSVPVGFSRDVIRVALDSGARNAQLHGTTVHGEHGRVEEREVVGIDTSTPVARRIVDALMASAAFEPDRWDISIVHPRAMIGADSPRRETRPVWVPDIDVYEDLWQFSHVTWSLVGRSFFAALLLAYGMIERNLPLMIAGLLFLPYHHQMLAMAYGLRSREPLLATQGLITWMLCTFLIVLAGAAVAAFSQPPLKYDQFGTVTTGIAIAAVIGAAAALASADDAGRRELIGLAATAHISVLPAWLGISLVFGLPDAATTGERVASFALSVLVLVAAAACTYALVGGSAQGLRAYASSTSRR